MNTLLSLDLFSGAGGLTEGLRKAGFVTRFAFEINPIASRAYKLNHQKATVLTRDIRSISTETIKNRLRGEPLHLLAGCPPCQGFSSIRRLNRKEAVSDDRNDLILEYQRFVRELRPMVFMMENVPGLQMYDRFQEALREWQDELKYDVDYAVVNVRDYGVPQNRKRLVVIGSRIGRIGIAPAVDQKATVRSKIGHLPSPEESDDPVHKIFPTHTEAVAERIRLTPKNGGSRKDLPAKYLLKCHQKANVGFNDVYGRLRWDDYSTTITGGCLNPSKGRFLHPEQDRCISAREAALLQSFPESYKFPIDIPIGQLALLIGNALPPEFSYQQAKHIRNHIEAYLKEHPGAT